MVEKTGSGSEENSIETILTKKTVKEQILDVVPVILDVIFLVVQIVYIIGETVYRWIRPEPPKDVREDIVLITGTGHGIGKQLALTYASEGALVVALDINEENNNKTIKEIEAKGYRKAFGYKCDVSNRKNVLEVAKKVEEDIGIVTILINNAGIMPTHPLADHTEEEIRRIFDINVMGHFWTIEAFLPGMKKLNHGHIVGMSSLAGLAGLANLVPYCASKFAVRGLMETLGEELRTIKNNRIKTTLIYPYMADTGLCKRPRIKFKKFMALLDPEYLAKEIMKIQRHNMVEATIPGYLFYLNLYVRLLPYDVGRKVLDFIGSGVESDL